MERTTTGLGDVITDGARGRSTSVQISALFNERQQAAAVSGTQRGVLAGAAGVETGSDGGAAAPVNAWNAFAWVFRV
jgi:hypothetical protein